MGCGVPMTVGRTVDLSLPVGLASGLGWQEPCLGSSSYGARQPDKGAGVPQALVILGRQLGCPSLGGR